MQFILSYEAIQKTVGIQPNFGFIRVRNRIHLQKHLSISQSMFWSWCCFKVIFMQTKQRVRKIMQLFFELWSHKSSFGFVCFRNYLPSPFSAMNKKVITKEKKPLDKFV